MMSLSVEVSESSALGCQAGINEGFKTFTIQLRAPPSWALKGIHEYCVINTWLQRRSIRSIFRLLVNRSVSTNRTSLHFLPPCPGHQSSSGCVLKSCWSLTKLCLVWPRSTFLNCWFLLSLWDPTGPQPNYWWWSQIKPNRRSCQLFLLIFRFLLVFAFFFCLSFLSYSFIWPSQYIQL